MPTRSAELQPCLNLLPPSVAQCLLHLLERPAALPSQDEIARCRIVAVDARVDEDRLNLLLLERLAKRLQLRYQFAIGRRGLALCEQFVWVWEQPRLAHLGTGIRPDVADWNTL